MLQSMTGFGNASIDTEFGTISVDVRSLNGKNLDLNLNINPIFISIESKIRSILTNFLFRGKVDIKINFKFKGENFSPNLNHHIIKKYISELKKIASADESEFLKIAMRLPNAVENDRPKVNENVTNNVLELINVGIKELVDFRIQEGNSLKIDILNNIKSIQEKLKQLDKLSPERINIIKDRIKKHLKDLDSDLDPVRFEQELIYYLEKIDINEELVRLKNHLIFFKKTIDDKKNIEKGKKLSFISQEIGREINTIGSKSNHFQMQQIVVEMKNELEKIKEQLLNVL